MGVVPLCKQSSLYDALCADYDRFVNWPSRLDYELPFIEAQLAAGGARRVLDTACGSGMHAIALAQRGVLSHLRLRAVPVTRYTRDATQSSSKGGYDVIGADLSAGMVERARANAEAAAVDVRFEVAGFGALARTFGDNVPRPEEPGLGGIAASLPGGFDALLCLGNSLPHLLTVEALDAALRDFAAVLRPGGLLFIQNRNFDRVLARRERWMDPQSHREGETEWLFMRFYDFEPDGRLTFNVITLRRDGGEGWSQRVTATRLRPLRQGELTKALRAAGFGELACWGDMQAAPFDLVASPNLIVTARRVADL